MVKYEIAIEELTKSWEESAEHRLAAAMQMGDDQILRDYYIGRRISDMYGLDYLMQFIEERPHIASLFDDCKPCDCQEGQCSMTCYYFKNGGCSNATE